MSDYVAVGLILAATVLWLERTTSGPDPGPASANELIPPVVTLVALTGIVLLVTAVVRNLAVFRGTASVDYYRDYVSQPPGEHIERPGRTFNNLLQVPMLFYAASALMMATGQVDTVQISLAWLYVGIRIVHAAVYIAFNHVANRFALFAASCIVLGVLWTRFALQAWPAG